MHIHLLHSGMTQQKKLPYIANTDMDMCNVNPIVTIDKLTIEVISPFKSLDAEDIISGSIAI